MRLAILLLIIIGCLAADRPLAPGELPPVQADPSSLPAAERHPNAWEEASGRGDQGWQARRAMLDDLYGTREFHHVRENSKVLWRIYVQRLLAATEGWLERFLPGMQLRGNGWIRLALYGTVLFWGVLLLVWVMRWKQGISSAETVCGSVAEPVHPAGFAPEANREKLRQEADRLAQEERFREAIRSLFVSVLLGGFQRGWWSYAPSRTHREYLFCLEEGSPRRECFDTIVALYERTCFGLEQPSEEQYRTCLDCVHKLEGVA